MRINTKCIVLFWDFISPSNPSIVKNVTHGLPDQSMYCSLAFDSILVAYGDQPSGNTDVCGGISPEIYGGVVAVI